MLQIYAFDPSLELDLDTSRVNRSVVPVAWEEDLEPGPVGQYVEVIDVDPASQCVYEPVNLNALWLLATDGLAPSEGNPQFHQQMVYAVAMRTIANFEQALGRTIHWTPRLFDEHGKPIDDFDRQYVERLRIHPHAIREANAYYSPDKRAVLFGYFNAQNADARDGLPGGIISTCLSHDVVAHEMTHAILDGIHHRLLEATNPDMLALHEGFADVVAVFQHFTLPGVLEHELAKTRGDLETENGLAKLAIQFGRATNRGDALRDALGEPDPDTGLWRRRKADPSRINETWEPHARGAIFVAAVFDAFLAIYRSHVVDLLRIATGGSGVLPAGELHPDLVNRLADEARTVAQRLLTICLRALDYLPPLDVTFGDYLRAMVTIDADLIPDDPRNYRGAIIRTFRDWGVYPRDVRTLSTESLRWWHPGPAEQSILQRLLPELGMLRTMTYADGFADVGDRKKMREAIAKDGVHAMSRTLIEAYQHAAPAASESSEMSRRTEQFLRERQFAVFLHAWLKESARKLPSGDAEKLPDVLGVDLAADGMKFEVHALRPTTRVRSDGRTKTELLVILTQRQLERMEMGDGPERTSLNYRFRGGCTLLIDPDSGEVRYVISKRIGAEGRRQRQEEFYRERLEREGLDRRGRYGLWLDREASDKVPQEPFRMLHRRELTEDW